MDNDFFEYLKQLELMAFFSGYPLLYAVVVFIAGEQPAKNGLKKRIFTFLPFAYALVGTLFLGLQLKNLYPDYSIENIKQVITRTGLVIWGLLSVLFWMPALAKKPVLSLLHSLVFFFLLLKDLFLHFFRTTERSIIRNDMKIYTDSLLLNFASFFVIVLLFFLFSRYKKIRSNF